MKFDQYGFIVMEQTGPPGNVGDSCAETSRYVVLSLVASGVIPSINLTPFVTDVGVLRHPDYPLRESDTSDDQESPLIAAAYFTNPALANKVITQIVSAGNRTGNGQLIHPTSWSQIKRAQGSKMMWLYDLAILGQALILKLPYHWDDGKTSFEPTVDSSADYLNLINYLAFAYATHTFTWACKLVTKWISYDQAFDEVSNYYLPEPNDSMILKLYADAIQKIWD